MDRLKLLKNLEYHRGIRDLLKKQLDEAREKLDEAENEKDTALKAQGILQEAAKRTQMQVQYRISELVSLAMENVFDDPYKINLNFDTSRGKTTAKFTFEKDGESINPLDASGGGAVDVASFGLQVSLWTLQRPRSRNLLILDEPLKWLKGGLLPDKGAQMLHQISHKLGLQIIMVSHSPELISNADKVFEITKVKGVSCVKEKRDNR